jgi:hypothetical protein
MIGRILLSSLVGLSAACGTGALGQSRTLEGHGRAADPLSAPLAVGASFMPEVVIETRGSAAPPLELLSVRPEVVTASGRTLFAKSPGVAAVLFREPNGVVMDLLHVWVASPTHLAVHRLGGGGEELGEVRDAIDLVIGDVIVLSPRAYAGTQRLAGTGESSWSIEPASLAAILRDGATERRRLLARAPGEGMLSVRTLGRDAKLRISVIAEPQAGGAS